jgi:hypothetical protein
VLCRSHYGLCQHAPTWRPHPIFRDLFLGAAQVLGKDEPENEPEQSIEKPWLTEAKKPNLDNSLKINGRVWARFFCSNEPE